MILKGLVLPGSGFGIVWFKQREGSNIWYCLHGSGSD